MRKLFSVGDRKKLARAFGRYFTVDKSFRSNKEIFSMLRLALYLVQENPSVNEVRFRADEAAEPGDRHAPVRVRDAAQADRRASS